ncbi:hypothetical protein VPH35_075003 [Triticum aestivum]
MGNGFPHGPDSRTAFSHHHTPSSLGFQTLADEALCAAGSRRRRPAPARRGQRAAAAGRQRAVDHHAGGVRFHAERPQHERVRGRRLLHLRRVPGGGQRERVPWLRHHRRRRDPPAGVRRLLRADLLRNHRLLLREGGEPGERALLRPRPHTANHPTARHASSTCRPVLCCWCSSSPHAPVASSSCCCSCAFAGCGAWRVPSTVRARGRWCLSMVSSARARQTGGKLGLQCFSLCMQQ